MVFSDLIYAVPGIVLLFACIDDLRSKKIHNKLILFMLPFVLGAVFFLHGLEGLKAGGFSVFFLQGLEGLKVGGFSALLALAIALPLHLFRVIGGGDLKLLVLIAFAFSWRDFLWISLWSLPWALILGLVKIALDRKMKVFLFNLFFLFQDKKRGHLEFHTIPYSIALFASWLSFLSIKGINFFN